MIDALRRDLSDRYTIERELGRGGMADVFLATDLRHERRVAIKVLRREVAEAIGRERFQREIATAARLQHPHILPLFEAGEAGGLLYYVMPLVEGESLRARLMRETQLPVDDAVRIAREIAEALAYAHSRGVVHRDVKPENILLESGHALLADFGVASAIGRESRRLTDSGIAVGTPAYMSPEQGAGERQLDGRSDIYALGCVLYEMLAGEVPFTGPTVQSIVAKRFTGVVPRVATVRPATPATVENAVSRALALVPADRWATSLAFAAALSDPAAPLEGPPLPRRVPWRVLIPLTAALLLGAGYFAFRGFAPGGGGSGSPRVAVLPFDNLGPADQRYFADGITDEVRGKLALIPGLTVIARASSVQYRGSTKPPQQIGRELGVAYLLTGTVRWDKRPDGTSQVQVSPELIRVSDAGVQWEQGFDAPLTDVFQVQTNIARQVATSLNLALAGPARLRMAAQPTANLSAYDAFLRGEEVSERLGAVDPATMRQAVDLYAEAVRLDTGFALAWAQLGAAHALHFTYNPQDTSEQGQSFAAARHAVALDPGLPAAHVALGICYTLISGDHAAALEEYRRAATLLPGPNADVLNALALAESFQGKWEASVADLRQAEGLDPRSVVMYLRLTRGLLWLRRHAEGLRVADSALALAPDNILLIEHKALFFVAMGDMDGAHRTLHDVPATLDRGQLVARVSSGWCWWMLDDGDRRLLLTLTPRSFDGDRAQWALSRAQVLALLGRSGESRSYADTARAILEARGGGPPSDQLNLAAYALALAYAGRTGDAVRQGERLVRLPEAQDQFGGLDYQFQLLRIYLLAGQHDTALARLPRFLRVPFYLTPQWLRNDPSWAPYRDDPRFKTLIHGSEAGS